MSRRRATRILLAVAAIAAIAWGVQWYRDWSFQLTAEYVAAQAIRDVTTYVEAHHGEWPRSWSDLPANDSRRPHMVRIEFGADVEELIRDPQKIQRAIEPVNGVYHTYPHASRQLEELREILAAYHSDPSAPDDTDDRVDARNDVEPSDDPRTRVSEAVLLPNSLP